MLIGQLNDSPTRHITWEDAYSAVAPQINAEGLLVWPLDPSFPVNVRFYNYDGRRDFRMCRHDYFEVFYAYSGEIVFQLHDRLFPIKQGDLIIINSTQYHTVHPPPNQATCPTLNAGLLYFMPEVIRAAEGRGEDMEYLMPFLKQDADFPHVITSQTGIPAQIFDLMEQISFELSSASNRARLSVKTYLKMILIKLVNHYAAYQGTDDIFDRKHGSIERLRPLFNYLDEHYSEPIPLEEAAALVAMSKSHFLHFFKQVTGLSFVNYLNQFRVARAQALLASTDKSIAEVSQEVGFCDQSYFGQVFRKLLGMTPREYKLHRAHGKA